MPELTESVATLINEFAKLPGYRYGIVPWWPTAAPPEELFSPRASVLGAGAKEAKRVI